MRFFLDTANLEDLKAGVRWGVVDGVTTNPTLIAKEGVPIDEQIRKICDIVNGDISAEVVATETEAMLTEGRKLAKIHKNVVVKVPLTRDGIRACSILLLRRAGDPGGQSRGLFHQPVCRTRGRYRLGRHGVNSRYRPDL
jgi:TalC/MipB family fructose-6-phosphate aldolase